MVYNKGGKVYLKIKLGDIFYANLNPTIGSEQDGIRPVLVVQNNKGNRFSPTIVIIPITSSLSKSNIPSHVELLKTSGLDKKSIALVEQIRTLDKKRLLRKITSIAKEDLENVKIAIKQNLNIRGLDIF
ncbi:MAG: type II toxin-antitoxin system PemK/MazF family toxin [Clostridia bacterium]|nr:type II toxin-antitoxin system PemK/MazF family toxin [Clostridia bacterium]